MLPELTQQHAKLKQGVQFRRPPRVPEKGLRPGWWWLASRLLVTPGAYDFSVLHELTLHFEDIKLTKWEDVRCKCCIVVNWTCFSSLKTFHLSSKRLPQF